jgi:hypothetical protein
VRELLYEAPGGKKRFAERGIGATKCCLVSVEGVVAIAFWDAGGGKATLFALGVLAIARARDPKACFRHYADETNAVTDGTYTHLLYLG